MRDEREDRIADLVDAQLRYLCGEGPQPDLGNLSESERVEVVEILELVEALADFLPASPPMEQDPVAIQLGLVEERPANVLPFGDGDPIIVSIREVSHRLDGAVHYEVTRDRVPSSEGTALICRSFV